MSFFLYFFLFFTYSVIGWIIEVVFVRIFTGKWSNRGFLIGPYLPIYGVAALTMHFTLTSLINYPIVIFVLAAVIISIIEYTIHYSLEKIFKTRWWDYSQLPFNVDGRICLIHAILFGILGILFILWLDPYTMTSVAKLNNSIIIISSIIMVMIFTVDGIISLKVISKVTATAEALKKDRTNEINEKVKEVLLQQSYLTRRLVTAFPNFHTLIKYTHRTIKKTHTKIKDTHKKTHAKIKDTHKKINNKFNNFKNGTK